MQDHKETVSYGGHDGGSISIRLTLLVLDNRGLKERDLK